MKKVKNLLPFGFLMLLAAFLSIYRLARLGYGNSYYAAAIKSMTTSFSNFFFVSFDSAGFISVDKAPLSLWVDAIFAKMFGFTGFAILLPHALEGIIVTVLVYKILKKVTGPIPSFLGSLVITLSPVNVAIYRNNTPDALLLVFVLLAIYFILNFFEKQKLKYLIISAVMIGLGFNTKMLQAFLVLPAIIASIFLFSSGNLFKKIKNLFLFLIVTVVVSFSWITIVDLTPTSMRPYVGSSTGNSAWNLAFGYNGMQRLLGEHGVGGTPGFNVGSASLTRLFEGEMATQTGWFIGSAIVFCLLFFGKNIKRFLLQFFNRDQKFSLLEKLTFIAGVFFITGFLFFSYASFFHSYYLNILAISIALLFGCLMENLLKKDFQYNLLLISLAVSLVTQTYLIKLANYSTWLIPIILTGGIIAILVLFIFKLNLKIKTATVAILFICLFSTPYVWSAYTTFQGNTATAIFIGGPSVAGGRGPGGGGPGGGPGGGRGNPPSGGYRPTGQPPMFSASYRNFGEDTGRGGPGGGGPGGGGMFDKQSANSATINYLKKNYNGEKYFVAVSSSQQASGFILDNNILNVMNLGGFSGRDNAISLSDLIKKITVGEIRFFMLDGNGDRGGKFNANQSISSWVGEHCTQVANISGLYDCKIVK